MMRDFRKQIALFWFFLLTVQCLNACNIPGAKDPTATATEAGRGEIPTWTPRPQDLTAQATATKTPTVRRPVSATQASTKTPRVVRFQVSGGNLNVRRGPGLSYNFVGVIYDGEEAQVIGRDRISRWVKIELPSEAGKQGWVTTETRYSKIEGDVSSLPFIKTEPAKAAFIRNCTKHKLWVLPEDVYLLSKYDEPYNEERFSVGVHFVYDLEDPKGGVLIEVSLFEGKRMDIRRDWEGEKSKCE